MRWRIPSIFGKGETIFFVFRFLIQKSLTQRRSSGFVPGFTINNIGAVLITVNCFHWCVVFESPVQSGFLTSKWGNCNCNWSRTDPDIGGTELDHLGPVFFG
ncbi:hypothetical protein L208DRAFT_1314591 [Tricholoma matsutake]|nr:hypothetical protein L208DRAFT_1314591 [Tricholoma matsutake 945]